MASLAFGADAVAQQLIPHGSVARFEGERAVAAWYADPTRRYPHGALGDGIEAGMLVVAVDDARFHLVLPETQVFEDDTPRIVDLDANGTVEIITIRSEVEAGAAVAVYTLDQTGIVERAVTPPIGQRNRWLSIAAIEAFGPHTRPLIAVVRTPHIGGELEMLELLGDQLVSRYPRVGDVTSHILGDPQTSFAATGDMDGDGGVDLLLTDQSRRNLIALSFENGAVKRMGVALPARLAGKMDVQTNGDLGVPLENGEMFRVPLAN